MSSPLNLKLIGTGSAAMVASFVVTMQASVTTQPAADIPPVQVNRTLKGDRLPADAGRRSAWPGERRQEPRLPEGCISEFEARKNIFNSEVAGRCVA
jgi:hypothetical protein